MLKIYVPYRYYYSYISDPDWNNFYFKRNLNGDGIFQSNEKWKLTDYLYPLS
jgi:hypothetical protein